ncbi:hypothetical protein Tco_0251379 [Tanacetum coccineum]
MSKEVGTPRYLSLVAPLKKVGDEAVHKELGDRMEKAATTASSLEAEQDSGNGPRCQDIILGDVDAQTRFEITSKQFNDPPLSRGYTLGSGEDINAVRHMLMLPVQVPAAEVSSLIIKIIIMSSPKFAEMHNVVAFLEKPVESDRFAEIIDFLKASSVHYALIFQLLKSGEDSDQLTNSINTNLDQPSTSFKPKKKQPSKKTPRQEAEVSQDETEHKESIPTPFNDPQPSGKDSMQLTDLMVLCTKLQTHVLDLEKAKDAQAMEIAALKKRIQRLEGRKCQDLQGRSIADLDKDDDVTLVDETQERQDDELVFDTGVLDADEMLVEAKVMKMLLPPTIEEITLAQNTYQIKAANPKVLEAELIEEEKITRKQEEEANIALIESWDNTQANTQAMMEADFELAQKLQTKEQGEITIEERSRLFAELMNKRKKHFAMLKAEEKRRKLPTKAQKRNQMSTYLKNMCGYKHNQLKSKIYEEIQKMFDNEMRRVNTFIPIDSEVVKSKKGTEESSKGTEDELESNKLNKVESSKEKAKGSRKKILGRKRAEKEQQQESPKRQKLEDDKESDEHEEVEADDTAELKNHLVIKKDDDIAIHAIPLATKPPVIVDYKLHKEGVMVHYQLIRVDGSSKRYSSMIRLLQGIDRKDL